jgi:hypothetical protein
VRAHARVAGRGTRKEIHATAGRGGNILPQEGAQMAEAVQIYGKDT